MSRMVNLWRYPTICLDGLLHEKLQVVHRIDTINHIDKINTPKALGIDAFMGIKDANYLRK